MLKVDEIISNKGSFYRNTIFIFMAGFFMLIHEFLDGYVLPGNLFCPAKEMMHHKNK